jgi:cytochrome oxidase Cu insertion factor (SCO1/SenC/PrrC family)
MLVQLKTWMLAATALVAVAGVLEGQQTSVVAAADSGPRVNDVAPDFALAGATRYGLLKTPVRLSDYRGRTVVLAFFYQARTKG